MIHNYMVICYDQKRAFTLFKRLCNYLRSKNIDFKANRVSNSINIPDLGDRWIVRFVSTELYYTVACRGFHGHLLNGSDVEMLLDDLEEEIKKESETP